MVAGINGKNANKQSRDTKTESKKGGDNENEDPSNGILQKGDRNEKHSNNKSGSKGILQKGGAEKKPDTALLEINTKIKSDPNKKKNESNTRSALQKKIRQLKYEKRQLEGKSNILARRRRDHLNRINTPQRLENAICPLLASYYTEKRHGYYEKLEEKKYRIATQVYVTVYSNELGVEAQGEHYTMGEFDEKKQGIFSVWGFIITAIFLVFGILNIFAKLVLDKIRGVANAAEE